MYMELLQLEPPDNPRYKVDNARDKWARLENIFPK